MRDFKDGDKVLVEGVWAVTGDMVGWKRPKHGDLLEGVHPHPGVPVADLVEELELLNKNAAYVFNHVPTPGRVSMRNLSDGEYLRLRRLRAAREAAQEPKLKEGQEVWVRGRIVHQCGFAADAYRVETNSGSLVLTTDDIRTEEPPEKEIM